MTDWNLQGKPMPRTQEEWEAEFRRYQDYPEYKRLYAGVQTSLLHTLPICLVLRVTPSAAGSRRRRVLTGSAATGAGTGMNVDDFKNIFFWEWTHRMAGRSIGFLFGIPFALFAVSGRIPRSLAPRLTALFLLGGSQGLVGWWMVKSGLDEVIFWATHPLSLATHLLSLATHPLSLATLLPSLTTRLRSLATYLLSLATHSHSSWSLASQKRIDEIADGVPRVSPYRLASHLTCAFVIFTLLLHTGLGIVQPRSNQTAPALQTLYLRIHWLAILVGITAISGAFVAGMQAA